MPIKDLKISRLFGFLVILAFSLNTLVLAADVTPPVTTLTVDPAAPDGLNNWYVSPVNFTFNASDLESGVESINYRLNGGPWQSAFFDNTLNLAPNPSFEDYDGASNTQLDSWEATTIDGSTTYTQDATNYAPGFSTASSKITTTASGWHGINHKSNFSVATPFANMNAAVWVKTEGLSGNAYFKVYSVSTDAGGGPVYTYLDQSPSITGTNDWTKIELNFVVTDADSIGVYLDLGYDDPGTAWFDAVTLNDSTLSATAYYTVGADRNDHILEYYSKDRANNSEVYSCATSTNCFSFKLDQTPPGNWRDAGAIRGLGGSEHEIYVYTTVDDVTSGLSTNTNKYMYYTPRNPDFGYFENLIYCNTPWYPNQYTSLLDFPSTDGLNTFQLRTQRTDVCDSDWKVCKIIRFYAEDIAGNVSTKDFCINGPWIYLSGEGIVRSNHNIDMIAEPEDDNTDGLIEAGGSFINFFTSSQDWRVTDSAAPRDYNYNSLFSLVAPVTTVSDINVISGVFLIDGDHTLNNSNIPNSYDTATFNHIFFINGNLTIDADIDVDASSSALYVVKGYVQVGKSVNDVEVAIVADGDFFTAYDLKEGQTTSTLSLRGIYAANKFHFQRTLQGTNNSVLPSESFTYEPKYLNSMREYFGENGVIWLPYD